MTRIFALCLLPLSLPAQLPPPNAAGVAMGHYHFFTEDMEAHRKVWVDVFGARQVKVGPMDAYLLPDLIVLLRKQTPSGGTEGSTIGHVGMKVKDMQATLDKCRAAGVKIDSGANPGAKQAFLNVAEGVRIELLEDKAMTAPAAHHHIHWYTSDVAETKAWYVKMFGAKPGRRGNFEAADIPGANLTFTAAEKPVVPTAGRALDHIGFEVRDLAAFCKQLVAQGAKLDMPFTPRPDLGIALAFLTDPWGVRIELTEGLSKLR